MLGIEGDHEDTISRALALVRNHGMARELIRAAWLRGRLALSAGESAEALVLLERAMEEARRIGWVEIELSVGADLTRVYARHGDPRGNEFGQGIVAEAQRCQYRLVCADAWNALAEWYERHGFLHEATASSASALAFSVCDGAPFSYEAASLEAKGRVDRLQTS
jgi:hypothetical protein